MRCERKEKCEDDFVSDPELGTSCDHLVIEVLEQRRVVAIRDVITTSVVPKILKQISYVL